MNALAFLVNSLGSVIAFCIALYLDYRWQAIVGLFIPCLFLFAFIFVPETPAYLQSKCRIVVCIEAILSIKSKCVEVKFFSIIFLLQEAANAFEFYKGEEKMPEIEKFMIKDGAKDSDTRLTCDDFCKC